MAQKAGIVTIDVAANVSKLVKGMDRAEQRTNKAFNTMKKAAIAFAGVFVTGKLIGAINTASASIDKLAKTSDRLGISTEALIGFQYAAELSGTSVQTLEMAMQRMSRRVAQDAQSSKQALEAMNIPLEEFKNMGLEQQMLTVADGLKGIESQSERVSIAFKLFDSEGVKVVNMLQQGSGALNGYRTEAEQLGIVMSRSMAAAVEDSNDAMMKFGKTSEGTYRVLSVQLAPYITIAANTLVDFFKSMNATGKSADIFQKIIQNVAKVFIVSFNTMRTALDGWVKVWSLVEVGYYKVAGSQQEYTDAIGRYNEAADIASASADELLRSLEGQDAISISLQRQLDALTAKYNKLRTASGHLGAQGAKDLETIAVKAKDVENILVGGISGEFRRMADGTGNFKDAVSGMAKDVIAHLFKVLIVQKAINAAMGIDFGGGSSIPAATAATGGITGAKASGGAVAAGRSYMVGESGREIFTPTGSGVITPNNDLGATVNVFNNTGAEVETRENDEGGIDVILKAIEPFIANGIARRTSPIAAAIKGLR